LYPASRTAASINGIEEQETMGMIIKNEYGNEVKVAGGFQIIFLRTVISHSKGHSPF
jgi:hypothetical protein